MTYFETLIIKDKTKIDKPKKVEKEVSKDSSVVNYELRALLDKATETASRLVLNLDIPDKLKPALKLYLFNNIIERQGQAPVDGYEAEVKKGLDRFKPYINNEVEAEKNKYLPPIGIEIEIPPLKLFGDISVLDYDFFDATQRLGIPAGKDEFHEFAVDYSYSASTQSLIAHELIRGQFIPTVEKDNKKKIFGQGDFSLHINLGFLKKSIPYKDVANSSFNKKSLVLTNALTLAFTSASRLWKKKTSINFKVEPAEPPSARDNNDSKWQRLEIRSLEVRDETVYRLLSEAQLLGSSLFSSFTDSESSDEIQVALKNIWLEFEEKMNTLQDHYWLGEHSLDKEKYKSMTFLKFTNLQTEVRKIVTETCLLIKQVLKSTTI